MTIDWEGFKFPKQRSVKLEGEEYRKFKKHIFTRDNWMCRNPACRSRRNLTLHHKIRRSKVRLDTEENCLTLCVECHDLATQFKLDCKDF